MSRANQEAHWRRQVLSMSRRRAQFIELANEKKREDTADALERSRQADGGGVVKQTIDESEKYTERKALDRRVRACARIENMKRVLREHPELKMACHLIGMGVAFLAIQWLLINGEQEW